MAKKSIRVLLVDDHVVLRTGLCALLNAEPDIQVVGEASDGAEALQKTKELKPDVVVMDISMPGMNGLDATRQIAEQQIDSKVLVLTMHSEKQYIIEVLKAGGIGYVMKSAADDDLINAIHTVHQGKPYLYADATQVLLEQFQTDKSANDKQQKTSLDQLSEREKEVLTLTAKGFTSREIGEMLFISSKTVDTYRQRLMAKLDLHHRVDLVRYALQNNLLTFEEDE